MITVEYLNEEIESEPGPNFYWRGEPKDFLCLINDLHLLGAKEDVEVNLIDYNYIKLINVANVKAVSSLNGGLLCKRSGDDVLIDLNRSTWRELLGIFLMISFYPSHHYVDFEESNLFEDANFIVSSEA